MDAWEASFSSAELARGREIYREGLISGLELGREEAIVHCAFARKDTCYAVIEWSDHEPSVRSSTEDTALGRAVAVAGLYEIEELIADEIAPLPGATGREGAVPVVDGPVVDAEAPAVEAGPEVPPARSLSIQLQGSAGGLRLMAYWKSGDKQEEPVFDSRGAALHTDEREQVVRLTGRAREAGFVYRQERSDFILKDPERIAVFFAVTREKWEGIFGPLALDMEAAYLAEGIRELKVVGRVEGEGRRDMRVDWRFRVGRQWLDPEDAARLVRSGRGTHLVRGLGLVRIGEDQSEALEAWRVAALGKSPESATWPRYMMFSLFAERGAELDLEEALQSWRQGVTEATAAEDPVEQPDFLRPYQRQGVQWMARLCRQGCHGLLADEMGLGKTLQVLTLFRFYPVERRDALIVCPASVVPVWESEVRRWYPELGIEILRSGNDFTNIGAASAPRIWVASYTQLRRHKHLLDTVEFGYAVLDEAQQIKNPEAKVTQACCSIRAECRLALTGTPIENRLLDLWTLFRFLMPGLLGNRRRFEAHASAASLELRRGFEARLKQQIAPFLLRRKKEQVVSELPPKVEIDLICPITELQRHAYNQLLNRGRETMGDDLQLAMQSHAMNFFTLLTRLRQVCCDPGLLPGATTADIRQSGKVQMLLTRLEEALQGEGARKVVVFSQFVQLLKRLKPELRANFPKLKLYELTGQTRDRSLPVQQFQEDAGPAVILVSLRAGGTGITLHAADYVFLLDPWWNPAVESQAIDRVHRIGQERPVFVYRMITEGTIEQRIQQLKTEKRVLFEATLGQLGSAREFSEQFADLEDLAKLLPGD